MFTLLKNTMNHYTKAFDNTNSDNPLLGILDEVVIRELESSSSAKVTIELLSKKGFAGQINYERVLEFWYKTLLPRFFKGANVIDVGAHKGRHTGEFLALGYDVYAFEVQPKCLEELNKKFGKDSRFHPQIFALTDKDGEGSFIINHGAVEESGIRERIYNNPETKELESISVKYKKLDSLNLEKSEVSFIKIDIEGGEIGALNGAVRFINLHRPLISVEYGRPSYSVYGHQKGTLLETSKSLKYVVVDIFGNVLDGDIYDKCVDTIYWDYILVPEERTDVLQYINERRFLLLEMILTGKMSHI